jgi:hypothetical protein
MVRPLQPPPSLTSPPPQRRLTQVFLIVFLIASPVLVFNIFASRDDVSSLQSPLEGLSAVSLAGLFTANASGGGGVTGCTSDLCSVCVGGGCTTLPAQFVVSMITSLV